MSSHRLILLIVEIITFISYIWALTSWLKKVKQTVTWELNFIKYGGLIFTISHLLIAAIYPLPDPLFVYLGIGLLLFGLIIFWLSVRVFETPPAVAFAEIITTELKTTGPYKYIRHPIYTSYMFAWIGGAIATNCWWLIISFIAMGYLYNRAAIQEEKMWLLSKDSNAYKSFMISRGRFLPRIM
jgi:protein-S-isoprenylcysteine O-methyltransferase Ste14